METVVNLQKNFFTAKEQTFIESGKLSASGFTYAGDICALRIKNDRGELIILPFKGQQIWRARFDGVDLTMKSMFDEPRATDNFGESYGCFMLHCGMTAMGNPAPEDTHPQHGELPTMRYDTSYIVTDNDEQGRYMEVVSEVYYRRAFGVGYIAKPKIRIYENDTLIDISMTVTNRRSEPLAYAYLCHVNFRPIEGARLVDSSNSIFVHEDIPENLPQEKAEALKAYFERIKQNPEIINLVDSKTQTYEPEIVFTMKYDTDPDGWAHCMQIAPEGYANYLAFRPEETPIGIRWIARTPNEDAMGMVLPATAEHKGYNYLKEKGQLKYLPPNESITFRVKTGYIEQSQVEKTKIKFK
ncbi:MAG: DUF4432 family protein [Clostridiaceae bacterium]|nr:DUF4432 family protein [Clostridiaceae bacterium]